MQADHPATHLVVVGASAGGIEALSKLLEGLPADFPAPMVIAQHLEPSRVSRLQPILSQHTTLPVRTVNDQAMLEPGVIYVVPANQHVEVTDHALSLRPDGAGPKPSVDRLLASAAEVFGERLVAVILSGMGSDGSNGAWQVKQAGGTIIIQDPRTASYPGMPLALAPTTVDIVADLEAIGPLLHELLSGVYRPLAPDEADRMRLLLEQLREASGIDFSSYRQPTIQRRLQRRMLDTGTGRLEDYARYLRRHPEEYQRLASSFLIKVTDFFRDPELFDYLREQLLPVMLDQAREQESELRFWSAGCATGEEAYSLAILMAELLRDDLELVQVRIFATDLDNEAVNFARRGLYPSAALGQLSPELRDRYFSPVGGGYEVKKFLRRLMVFGRHDLGQRSPFPRIDMVLCRNVLIYFTPELQRRALQLFAFALKPGGRLVLGKAETSSPLQEYFALEHPRLKIYRRQENRIQLPVARIRDAIPTSDLAPPRPRVSAAGRQAQPELTFRADYGARATTGLVESALLSLPIGLVVINQRYSVQVINAAARRALEIHTTAIGEDLVHLAARLPSAQLRAAIDRAFRGQPSTERFEVRSLSTRPGSTVQLEISFQSQEPSAPGGQIELVVVLVNDLTPSVEPQNPARRGGTLRDDLEQTIARVQGLLDGDQPTVQLRSTLAGLPRLLELVCDQLDQLDRQLEELDQARSELLNANQELTSSNQELRKQNEELLVAQEEAEAAAEEVETLNEEQQATNEELETLNEELQATVEELNTTNEDLEARQEELQGLASSLDAERSRLEAILASMADGVLLVDRVGSIVLTNPAFDRLFGPAGLRPEQDNGQPLAAESWPQRRALGGETFRMKFSARTTDGSTRRFEVAGQPTQSPEPLAVLVIRDISERETGG